MKRKIISMLMVAVFSLSIGTMSFANDSINTNSTPVTRGSYYEIWKIKDSSYEGTKYGKYQHLTLLGPADADGETFSVAQERSVAISINGSLQVPKSALGSELGFDVTESVGVVITKNSRPLKKGETIKVDYRVKEHKYNVIQECTIHMDGQTIKGKTSRVTVSKPDPYANVRFTYISSRGVPYRSEEYKAYPNGVLKLVSEKNL
ncbi:hypothetical protein [Anaerophilus nitritogenes]|uniref:hypothetical protein n=1 Tax=Anaerophilus nitritogenes TaxID=2498136 RepID=UPI00101DD27A|nr:hypothetical protein [Anaerophilus nitritogenes]